MKSLATQRMLRMFGYLMLGVLILSVIAWWNCLPDPLFKSSYSSVLYSREGQLMGARIADDQQWRFPPLMTVPDKFAAALITYEDRRFHEHEGVDSLAVLRAAALNVKNDRLVSGASTITMQVAKLSRGRMMDRTLADKLIEMAMALRLEQRYSKAEILAMHAANAPFGGNVVGLEAAAWRYFGRTPDRLSWAEACTLAVLPNSPALIHPGRNRERLLERRDRLLHRLQEQGALSALDLEVALHEPLVEAVFPLPRHAPHLLETLRARYPGIQRFQTTLDANLQITANAIVRERAAELARQDVHNLAVLIVDNRTFEVRAYVGNSNAAIDNEHGFAVDIVQRPRSTGSILKPLLHAAALESGDILPRTLLPDIPTQYAGYMPENFDRTYSGAAPADVALAQSLNVPAVRLLHQYGVSRFQELLTHAGLTTLVRRPDDYGLTLILGGAEGKLWDITRAYANLADIASQISPESPQPYRHLSVLRNLQEHAQALPRAEIGPAAAWLTLEALTEVTRPGDESEWRRFAGSRRIAWKTGTSWGMRDAWAIGTSPASTVGVWVGNATGEGRPGLTGGTAAAPVLFQLFNRVDSGGWFERPDLHMKQVKVCKDDGYLANGLCDAETILAPATGHFTRTSPYHIRVHLDAKGQHRVDGACESVMNMQSTSWFVLPPGQELYYRRRHAEYRVLPAFRTDCGADDSHGRMPMEFLYPGQNTRVYIPVDLAAQKGRVVFQAAHRDAGAVLYWHLDDRYVGETRAFHSEALDITPGRHVVTLVDVQGNRLSRTFDVIGEVR